MDGAVRNLGGKDRGGEPCGDEGKTAAEGMESASLRRGREGKDALG